MPMRRRVSGTRWFAVLGCAWFAGCLAVGTGLPGPGGKTDSLQEELRKAEVVETKVAYWRLKPDAVLKEVPLQTALAQAQSVMQGHGFSCRQEKIGPGNVSLICKASQRTGWRGSQIFLVTFACRWDKLTGVKVITYYD